MNNELNLLQRDIDAIPVPQFEFAAVIRCAEKRRAPSGRWQRFFTATLMIAVPCLAAAAAVHFIPLQVNHRYGNWQLWGPSRTFTHPTAADFSTLAHQAPYRVVWPPKMPPAERLMFLDSAGNEIFIVAYRCPHVNPRRGNNALSTFIIVQKNYAAVNPNLGNWFESQMHDARLNAMWDTGEESVLLSSGCLTSQQVDTIRISMTAASRTQRSP